MPVRSARSPRMMRRMNWEAVLRYALDTDEFTAADMMRATGLTRATVLDVCADLASRGWLEELSDPQLPSTGRPGRPSRHYRLPTSAGLLLGLDAGEHRFRAMVTDLRGRQLGARELLLPAPSGSGPERLSAASALAAELLDEVGADPGEVLVSVVGVPAPVDGEGRSPAHDKGFWSLMNPGFGTALPGRVSVENDANLAAVAERAQLDTAGNMATLLSGERLGAGLIVDGRLLHGARGGAGELHALDIVAGAGSPDGLAALARTWALELFTDQPAARHGVPPPNGTVDAAWVFQAAERGIPGAEQIVVRLGSRLARVAMILASLLDVTTIVVAGAIAASIEPVLRVAREQLDADYPPPAPEILASSLGGDVVVLGAIERARHLLRADPLGFVPPHPAPPSD
ncbi:MAG: ROK family protein [Micropruina sp.]|uniref:ROK family transcriptional regulator n=1 Tax=Micropruina sp. TaxID=2737536 RepID=UPI0039E4D9AD